MKRKTGFVINPKDWSDTFSLPIQKTQELKATKSTLDKLALFINEAYNVAISKGIEIDEIPDELSIVPTLTEALDILEMEAIERDLGF